MSRPRRRVGRAGAVLALAVVVLVFGVRSAEPASRTLLAPGETVAFDMSLRSSGDAPAVEQWLRSGRLAAATIDPDGVLLHVSGTARDVEARLGVVLETYEVGPLEFHRPAHQPVLPLAIAPRVRSVIGLDDYSAALAHPNVGGRSLDACASRNACLTRVGVAKAFDLEALYKKNLLGNGQTVAVVMDGEVSAADLDQFDREQGINGPIDFTQVNVDPLQKVDTQGSAAVVSRSEATMDIETVHMVAPAAKIIYYQSTFAGTGMADAFERVLKDGNASIVTFSVGSCETGPPPPGSPRATQDGALAALKHAHVSVFVSSGDHGVYTCLADAFGGDGSPDWVIAGDYPADSPNVIAVGGTYLQHGPDDSYESEDAWVSPLTNWSTGGGVSPNDPAPPWQEAIAARNSASGNRVYPDVAAPADDQSGWTIVVAGADDRSSGTSAASPFWAGYAALVRQAAGQAHTGTFPFLAPVLYNVASSSTGAPVFHDVVRGSNLRDTAGPGWDDATGLGSPVASNLSDAIVAYLQQHADAASGD